MDKIKLKGLTFYGYHGLFPEENRLGQRFVIDLELNLSLQKAGQTDEMKYSIDYGMVYETVKNIVEGEARNLIETVAEMIAAELLLTFPAIASCTVEVAKPNPPIEGHYKAVAVEIFREREK